MTADIKAAWQKFRDERMNQSDAADIEAAKLISAKHATTTKHGCFLERRTFQIWREGVNDGLAIAAERARAKNAETDNFFRVTK